MPSAGSPLRRTAAEQRAAAAAPGAAAGIDIGGSKTDGVLLDGDGRELASVRLTTRRGDDGVVGTTVEALEALAERSGRGIASFGRIGIGVPGQVERSAGVVRHAYNIGVEQLALGPAIASRTGLPVSLDNDVTAAAIGAAHLMGLGGTVAYLNLGTGLSAGIVVDGRPLRGSHGFAGEIGHLPISPLGRPCPCGQIGCLETAASGSALLAWWPAGGPHPGRTLLPAVEAGDAEARAAFDHLVEGAASAVRLLALTIDPGAIVLGGGLRLLGAPLTDGISRTLDGWTARSPFLAALGLRERLRVLPEGSPVAVVGAALASHV